MSTQTLRPPELRTTFKGVPLERNRAVKLKMPLKEDSKADKAMDKKMGIKEGSKKDMPEKKAKK